MKIYISKNDETNKKYDITTIRLHKKAGVTDLIPTPISVDSSDIGVLSIEDYKEEILKDILSHIESNYEFYEMADMKSYIKSKIKELSNN